LNDFKEKFKIQRSKFKVSGSMNPEHGTWNMEFETRIPGEEICCYIQ
jgi:hypothetical protein